MKKNTITKVVAMAFLLMQACSNESTTIEVTANDLHKSIDKVTEIMVHDIFSPPVASRIYVYPNIGAYEILAQNSEEYKSLANQIHGLESIPTTTNENVNLKVAALVAHMDLSRKLIFSEDKMASFRDSLYSKWEDINRPQFEDSKAYGLEVSNFIKQWLDSDNYNETRTMPKFTVDADNPSRWQPTPPAYMDGIEPHWKLIKTMVLDSAAQFKPLTHPPFSMEEGSKFHDELLEVYEVSEEITSKGDESEEIEIAQFWDCNPYVSVTRGHLMFATKKLHREHIGLVSLKLPVRKMNPILKIRYLPIQKHL